MSIAYQDHEQTRVAVSTNAFAMPSLQAQASGERDLSEASAKSAVRQKVRPSSAPARRVRPADSLGSAPAPLAAAFVPDDWADRVVKTAFSEGGLAERLATGVAPTTVVDVHEQMMASIGKAAVPTKAGLDNVNRVAAVEVYESGEPLTDSMDSRSTMRPSSAPTVRKPHATGGVHVTDRRLAKDRDGLWVPKNPVQDDATVDTDGMEIKGLVEGLIDKEYTRLGGVDGELRTSGLPIEQRVLSELLRGLSEELVAGFTSGDSAKLFTTVADAHDEAKQTLNRTMQGVLAAAGPVADRTAASDAPLDNKARIKRSGASSFATRHRAEVDQASRLDVAVERLQCQARVGLARRLAARRRREAAAHLLEQVQTTQVSARAHVFELRAAQARWQAAVVVLQSYFRRFLSRRELLRRIAMAELREASATQMANTARRFLAACRVAEIRYVHLLNVSARRIQCCVRRGWARHEVNQRREIQQRLRASTMIQCCIRRRRAVLQVAYFRKLWQDFQAAPARRQLEAEAILRIQGQMRRSLAVRNVTGVREAKRRRRLRIKKRFQLKIEHDKAAKRLQCRARRRSANARVASIRAEKSRIEQGRLETSAGTVLQSAARRRQAQSRVDGMRRQRDFEIAHRLREAEENRAATVIQRVIRRWLAIIRVHHIREQIEERAAVALQSLARRRHATKRVGSLKSEKAALAAQQQREAAEAARKEKFRIKKDERKARANKKVEEEAEAKKKAEAEAQAEAKEKAEAKAKAKADEAAATAEKAAKKKQLKDRKAAKKKADEEAVAKAKQEEVAAKAKTEAAAAAKAAASVSEATSPLDGIPGWLESIEAGFAESFAAVFEEIGVEDVSDFAEMDEETMGELESALKDAGATDSQVGKITMGMVTGATPAAEPAEPATPAAPVAAAPTATAAPVAAKGPAPHEVPAWLDWVEAGFSESFAAVFEEIGAEDAGDFAEMDEETMGEVREALVDGGADEAQAEKIMAAMKDRSPALAPVAVHGPVGVERKASATKKMLEEQKYKLEEAKKQEQQQKEEGAAVVVQSLVRRCHATKLVGGLKQERSALAAERQREAATLILRSWTSYLEFREAVQRTLALEEYEAVYEFSTKLSSETDPTNQAAQLATLSPPKQARFRAQYTFVVQSFQLREQIVQLPKFQRRRFLAHQRGIKREQFRLVMRRRSESKVQQRAAGALVLSPAPGDTRNDTMATPLQANSDTAPTDWERAFDPKTQQEYFYSHSLRRSTWSPKHVASPGARTTGEPSEEIKLSALAYEEHHGQEGTEIDAEADDSEPPSAMTPGQSERGYQRTPASKDEDEDDWESAVDPQSGAQYFYSHKKKRSTWSPKKLAMKLDAEPKRGERDDEGESESQAQNASTDLGIQLCVLSPDEQERYWASLSEADRDAFETAMLKQPPVAGLKWSDKALMRMQGSGSRSGGPQDVHLARAEEHARAQEHFAQFRALPEEQQAVAWAAMPEPEQHAYTKMVQIELATKLRVISPEHQEQYWQSVGPPQMREEFESAIMEQGIPIPGLVLSLQAQASVEHHGQEQQRQQRRVESIPHATFNESFGSGHLARAQQHAEAHAQAQAQAQRQAQDHFAYFRSLPQEHQGGAWESMPDEEKHAYTSMINVELADKLKVMPSQHQEQYWSR